MESVGISPPALAWRQHLLHNQVDMSRSILYVEAIRYLEETFSSVLQTLARMTEHQPTTCQLSSVMKEVAVWLKQPSESNNIWLGLTFGVFSFGIGQILECSVSNPLNEDVTGLFSDAKGFFMEVLKQSLDALIKRSRIAGVAMDKEAVSCIKSMQNPENFESTVQEWVEYAEKWQERSHPHPWLSLNHDERKIYMRDFEITLRNSFSQNFRGIGHLARLALKTQDVEEGVEELRRNEINVLEVLDLITSSKEEHKRKQAAKVEADIAAEDAL